MDTDSSIVYIKTEDIYSDIAKYVETRFGTSNYELDRPLSKVENEKVIGLIKWKNNDTVCSIKTKIVLLINRWQRWK